jgi:hypothetical protein
LGDGMGEGRVAFLEESKVFSGIGDEGG